MLRAPPAGAWCSMLPPSAWRCCSPSQRSLLRPCCCTPSGARGSKPVGGCRRHGGHGDAPAPAPAVSAPGGQAGGGMRGGEGAAWHSVTRHTAESHACLGPVPCGGGCEARRCSLQPSAHSGPRARRVQEPGGVHQAAAVLRAVAGAGARCRGTRQRCIEPRACCALRSRSHNSCSVPAV